MFISKEDLNELMEDSNSKGYTIKIYKADNCTLSDRQFRRELNLETSAIDSSWMSVTKQDSFYYTFLFPQMFGSCLIVFLAFLMIIVLIAIRHSIATTIEIDYVNLGVLKSMGLSKNKMRSVFVLQYLLAQVIGSVIGFVAAIPLAKVLGNDFQSIISMPCDNEIVVSQATSEEPGINIGDTAQVSKSNKSADFMVVGIIQCPNDLGRNFAINIDGIKRMGVEDIEISYVGYSLSSTEHCQEIRDELNEKYSDILSCEIYANDTNSIISSAFDTLKLIIYTISAVFALVVVIMVCKKIFLQEKTDIGIYKAVGFKCTKLRLQFSVRFLIVALISSSFGIILSLLLSESLFEWMFKNIGVVTFKIQLSAGTVIIPAVTICICFFVFAFIVSRQVKKVDVKELITE